MHPTPTFTEKTVWCLMGPTAAGKTDLALALADQYPCELVSVDSVMVYRGLNIGSAKPDAATLERYPHHLVDVCDVTEPYSAGQFRDDVVKLIDAIHGGGKIPLLVGGTMLYFRALQMGIDDLPKSDPVVRSELEIELAEKGAPHLHERLVGCDPETANRLHPNDKQRIMRALEVYQMTGKPLSAWFSDASASPYDFLNWVIAPEDREVLHERIAERFRAMLASGLIEETKTFFDREDCHQDLPAFRAVGYRQVWEFLAGELPKDELCDRGIFATRQLAKRQLTWLRGWPDTVHNLGLTA